jgi:two-component system, cell cycle response regulator
LSAADEKITLPFRSLSHTLIRSIVVAATCCAIVVATLQVVLTWQGQRARFEAEVHSIAETSIPLLVSQLRHVDLKALNEQVKRLAERPQIAYAALQVRSGPHVESGDRARRTDGDAVTLDISSPSGGARVASLTRRSARGATCSRSSIR